MQFNIICSELFMRIFIIKRLFMSKGKKIILLDLIFKKFKSYRIHNESIFLIGNIKL